MIEIRNYDILSSDMRLTSTPLFSDLFATSTPKGLALDFFAMFELP
jgi:hypothetical protein